ncbi:hypothetical protein M426DRAFT_247889 [Hypoxylon sp. CI-4A]|nr:hypothetical protein M426DRAFT_247889 [Hypoxylon sp. CI-4A]
MEALQSPSLHDFRVYRSLRGFLTSCLLSNEIFACCDYQRLYDRDLISIEHWHDLQRCKTHKSLTILEKWEDEEYLEQSQCPLAIKTRHDSRKRVQRHFQEQWDRLRQLDDALPGNCSLSGFGSRRFIASSSKTDWVTGIQTIRKILRTTTNFTPKEILNCLMVAESMRLFVEETRDELICKDRFYNDFKVWRILVPAEGIPLFDLISRELWGTNLGSNLDATYTCNILTDQDVLLYLENWISVLVSDTADFIINDQYDYDTGEDRPPPRQLHHQSSSTIPAEKPLGYRWTHLEYGESPVPIETLRPPERIKDFTLLDHEESRSIEQNIQVTETKKPSQRAITVLIISTAVFRGHLSLPIFDPTRR